MKTPGTTTSSLSAKPASQTDVLVGEALVKQGLITRQQLQTALDEQLDRLSHSGQTARIATIIKEMGYASEPDLLATINNHYRLDARSLMDNIEAQVDRTRKTPQEKLPLVRFPIWLKLSIAMTVIVFLVSLSLGIVMLNRQRAGLYENTLRVGTITLNYFVNNAAIPLLDNNILRLNTLVKETTAVEGLLYAVIVDNDEVMKAHSDPSMIGKHLQKPLADFPVTRDGEVSVYRHTMPDGSQALNLSRPVMFKNKSLGTVHVGVSIDFIRQLTRHAGISILMVALPVVAVGIAVALFFGIRFSRPISRLVAATLEIGEGNYNHRIPVERNDELGQLASAFNQMGEELWVKSLMKESFGKYVGTNVLNMILANPQAGWLKGHQIESTVLFTDIRGFTAFSETREPVEVVEKLNECFEVQTAAIRHYGGYVDKYIGDAVLAVFGAPVFLENHTERALRAALEMRERLRHKGSSGNRLLGAIGIGLDTGTVVSGNIGTREKREYTVIGDPVNMASRLSGLAGPGEIIVTRSIYASLAPLIDVEPLAAQNIKGRSQPVDVYRVRGFKQ
jgi:adenylate cyclase